MNRTRSSTSKVAPTFGGSSSTASQQRPSPAAPMQQHRQQQRPASAQRLLCQMCAEDRPFAGRAQLEMHYYSFHFQCCPYRCEHCADGEPMQMHPTAQSLRSHYAHYHGAAEDSKIHANFPTNYESIRRKVERMLVMAEEAAHEQQPDTDLNPLEEHTWVVSKPPPTRTKQEPPEMAEANDGGETEIGAHAYHRKGVNQRGGGGGSQVRNKAAAEVYSNLVQQIAHNRKEVNHRDGIQAMARNKPAAAAVHPHGMKNRAPAAHTTHQSTSTAHFSPAKNSAVSRPSAAPQAKVVRFQIPNNGGGGAQPVSGQKSASISAVTPPTHASSTMRVNLDSAAIRAGGGATAGQPAGQQTTRQAPALSRCSECQKEFNVAPSERCKGFVLAHINKFHTKHTTFTCLLCNKRFIHLNRNEVLKHLHEIHGVPKNARTMSDISSRVEEVRQQLERALPRYFPGVHFN